MTQPPFDEPRGLWRFPGYPLVLTCLFGILAYPGITGVRELLGQRGLALSPIACAPLTFVVLAAMIELEPRVQAQAWWPKVKTLWYAFGVGVGMIVPIMVGVLAPLPVLEGLPPAVPTLLSLAPLALVLSFLARMGLAGRRRTS